MLAVTPPHYTPAPCKQVMHEAVDSGSHATACALCAALPEELLLQKSGDDLTPIGLAIATKGDRISLVSRCLPSCF